MYHINPKGDPGACKAKPGNCPYGGDSQHYETAAEAIKAYEKFQHENTLPKPTSSKRKAAEDSWKYSYKKPTTILDESTMSVPLEAEDLFPGSSLADGRTVTGQFVTANEVKLKLTNPDGSEGLVTLPKGPIGDGRVKVVPTKEALESRNEFDIEERLLNNVPYDLESREVDMDSWPSEQVKAREDFLVAIRDYKDRLATLKVQGVPNPHTAALQELIHAGQNKTGAATLGGILTGSPGSFEGYSRDAVESTYYSFESPLRDPEAKQQADKELMDQIVAGALAGSTSSSNTGSTRVGGEGRRFRGGRGGLGGRGRKNRTGGKQSSGGGGKKAGGSRGGSSAID